MSFVLDYRKRHMLVERITREARNNAEREGYATPPADTRQSTPVTRRRTFRALLVAGALLSIFNSGELQQYVRGHADSTAGQYAFGVSSEWHRIMQHSRATAVSGQVRLVVDRARASEWHDLRDLVDPEAWVATVEAYLGSDMQPVGAIKNDPQPAPTKLKLKNASAPGR